MSKEYLEAEKSNLGKKTIYENSYNPGLLFPIPRAEKRIVLGLNPNFELPFFGADVWNLYEFSCLNLKGKPLVAIIQLTFDCKSSFIIESKSLKLYFNSFNNSKFSSLQEVHEIIYNDLKALVTGETYINIQPLKSYSNLTLSPSLEGVSLDDLDIENFTYKIQPDYLSTKGELVTELLCSDLLKSNCPVTHQPDWASVAIKYTGNKICPEGLLKYLVSYRNENEFHENCIERIYMDILKQCKPQHLSIYGRSTRRGGLDINSYRANQPTTLENIPNIRLVRQ